VKREHFWIANIVIGFVVFGAAMLAGAVLPINPIPPIFIALVSISWATYSIFRSMDSDSMRQPLPVVLRWTCSVEGNCLTWRNKFFVEHPFLFALANRGSGLFFVIVVLVCTAGCGLMVWNTIFDPFLLRGSNLWVFIFLYLFVFGLLIAIWRMILDAIRHPVNHTVKVNLDKRTVYSKGIRAFAGSLETELPFAEIDGVLHHSFTYKFVTTHRLYVLRGKRRLMLFNLLSDDDYAAIRGRLDECGEAALREIAQFSNPQTQP
jgi:hypothetical protein